MSDRVLDQPGTRQLVVYVRPDGTIAEWFWRASEPFVSAVQQGCCDTLEAHVRRTAEFYMLLRRQQEQKESGL